MFENIGPFLLPVASAAIYAGYGLLTNKIGNPEEKVDGISLAITITAGAVVGLISASSGVVVDEGMVLAQVAVYMPVIYGITKAAGAIRKRIAAMTPPVETPPATP